MDGIITDNVPKALKMCESHKEDKRYRWSMNVLLGFIYLNFWIPLFGVAFRQRHGTCIDRGSEVDKEK